MNGYSTLATHAQAPAVLQVRGAVQLPREPPEPSGPQVLPAQLGTHWQVPLVEHTCDPAHEPPSSLHVRPVYFGVHRHVPAAEQVSVAEHAQHELPQPSGPQAFPEHERMQIVAMHWPEVLQV